MTFHVFTSITANYLPKARVLANSLRTYHSNIQFHLILSDQLSDAFNLDEEPFDSIIFVCELPITNIDSWIFKHTRVELCTAVKAYAFLEIIKRYDAEQIFYFDPDIVVFKSIDELCSMLEHTSILLTPHQTIPELEIEDIIENEISSLKFGIFNLGFIGVRTTIQGMNFLYWWKRRLYEFCIDNVSAGMFTDQRWIDLAMVFFEDICIVRDPVFNVATWNLTQRKATGSVESGIFINERPLCFFHFSGLDSGLLDIKFKKYAGKNSVLKELQHWYIKECEKMGQNDLGAIPWAYSVYDNGKQISSHERLQYRNSPELQKFFPNPFQTIEKDHSYYVWFRENLPETERLENGRGNYMASLLEDRENQIIELHTALREAQQLAWDRVPKIQALENALKDAQAIVIERDYQVQKMMSTLPIIKSLMVLENFLYALLNLRIIHNVKLKVLRAKRHLKNCLGFRIH